MPELSDVATGETIASEWGNDIRDRTIQRYANSAERDDEHPTPAQGDLSYLADTGAVDVFASDGWQHIGTAGHLAAAYEVDGSTEVGGETELTGSMVTYATVNLTIPTSWNSWKCEAYASYALTAEDSINVYETQVRIDGTDQQFKTGNVVQNEFVDGSVGGRRTGMATTGSRAILLRARATAGTVDIFRIYLYARAVRTS